MAIFYVCPSRHQLGQRYGELLVSMFPAMHYTPWDWPDLAEALASFVEAQAEAHLVYREDLDERLSVRDSLLRHFGADLHDEVIEVQFGPGLNHVLHQPWATESARKAA